jgi:mannose-6-phosphate isomerase-like protein (cupin superfamily)
VAIAQPPALQPLVDDPDDYRPDSTLALVVDPGGPDGRVDSICVIFEDVARGDRIPIHRHPVDELVLILEGAARVTLGGDTHDAGAGATVFIPAGVPHGHRNAGDGILRIRAVFPGTEIDIEMLERNPAPGTEDRPPARTVYDARTGAFRVVEGSA